LLHCAMGAHGHTHRDARERRTLTEARNYSVIRK
jgi:hypothetical protein